LAIDLRFRRSGFAIFEGPRRLLDFGTTGIPSGRVENARNRFSDLLQLSLPAIIVVRRDRWETLMARSEREPLIEALTNESETRGIQIRLLEQDSIISTFRSLGCETKAETSTALARIFPELVWRLPPERRVWESEHPRQSVFDAIALGLAYWQHESSEIGDSQEEKETREESI
jgi:hypothetical protein